MTTLKLICKLEKEHKKLSKKCDRLDKFLGSGKFIKLDPVMQQCLFNQCVYMQGYARCLINRISLLKHKEQEVCCG